MSALVPWLLLFQDRNLDACSGKVIEAVDQTRGGQLIEPRWLSFSGFGVGKISLSARYLPILLPR